MNNGHLIFTTNIAEALKDAEVLFISVGAPPNEAASADLKYVLSLASDCGKHMKDYLFVVTNSKVHVGTSEKVKNAIQEELTKRNVNVDYNVASNPESLKERVISADFLKLERIAIGVDSPRAEDLTKSLYNPFTMNGHPLIFMDIVSAAMTKYDANTMLATKISFINDIANLYKIVEAAINLARKGIDSDCVTILTEWPEFKFSNFKIVAKLLNNPAIFDGRNVKVEMKKNGFDYFCSGIDTTRAA